jgi:SAM-dependent methyltransferase
LTVSAFTSVDSSPDPEMVARYLDWTARRRSGMKHYVAAVHMAWEPDGPILDVGCGAGHDLELLADAGLHAVGVDPSAVLLGFAARRTADAAAVRLVRAVGERLPFADESFAGCQVERVLMHVADPPGFLAETLRCVRPGGVVTVGEPDWSSLQVRGDDGDVAAAWLARARNPAIGNELWELLEDAGCDVHQRVEELRIWRALETLDRVVGLQTAITQAIDAGRTTGPEAEEWLRAQRARDVIGAFRATLRNILIVASKR